MGTGEPVEFDLITIGAGSGGTRASRFSAQNYGAKVAIVELPFGFVSDDNHGGAGGTCVIRGCVPKKLLMYGSTFREEFKDSIGFGWEADTSPKYDWNGLIQKKAKEIARLNSVYNTLLKGAGVEFVEGWGSLVDAHTVEVKLSAGGVRRLTAKHILIATGGRAVKAPIPGAEHAITSDEALVLDSLPEKPIVVVGAGYISCEFAGIFNGFGADVHVMYRADKPLRGFDEECRSQVAENMEKRGIKLYKHAKPTKIEKLAEGSYVVHYDQVGQQHTIEAGLVMLGTGRKPNVDGLNLGAAGVELGKDGAIKVDEYSRTNVPGIWAIGDVTHRLDLTPVAIMEGMAFAATAFGNKPTPVSYHKIASAVFTQPPMATVGWSEEEAIEQVEGELDVYVAKFKALKNSITGRDEKTLIKMIVNVATDEVVGVHMVGPDAPEIMQSVAVALKCNAKKADFDSTVGIHPTSAEELVTMRQVARRVKGKGSGIPNGNNRV